jgi:hypothetical protein
MRNEKNLLAYIKANHIRVNPTAETVKAAAEMKKLTNKEWYFVSGEDIAEFGEDVHKYFTDFGFYVFCVA